MVFQNWKTVRKLRHELRVTIGLLKAVPTMQRREMMIKTETDGRVGSWSLETDPGALMSASNPSPPQASTVSPKTLPSPKALG